ncbi:ABC transporter ATP-binding protein [Dinoroseobacter sp. PD6]|uniref:ABC transporter ATP-binding protein n=1 Tax=Dinoroseobacter sp. PD6 TaxID=3028384 RepID=UPI00237B13DA|nr:ABC transporter ATP-binding protein [Dinoroseobacter sp. PD6]MDD9717935.1 ABC transporter ATP-binding protein [Dinoroseobacter sp. PD6]
MTSILKISTLTKRYGDVTALRDVSLEVAAGERVALLGHNGAGKSTLIKIVLGLIDASAGQASVLGAAPGSAAARRQVAYLPENVAFHPALTGLEQLRHYLSLRGADPRQAGELLARVGLGDAGKRRIGTYSKGMRQRVGLAQALIGSPKLLVLDEPTSGLDPVSRRNFYDLMDGLAAEGAAILLSSHALTEVEARTDRIAILSEGQLMTDGSLPQLRRRANLPVTMIITPHNGYGSDIVAALPNAIRLDTGVKLTCSQDEKLATLAQIAALGSKVAELEVMPPSLEDLYSHFSRRTGE